MSYINTLISSSGTEADFIKTFVSELIKYHGISVSIPQEYNTYNNFNDYIEAMYADTTSKPKFILSLNGLNITFERSSIVSNATNSYSLSSNVWGDYSNSLPFGSTATYYDNSVRAFRLCIATNDKNITALYLGGYNYTLAETPFSIVGISIPENIDGFAISTSMLQRAITQAFSLNNNRSASKIDRCNYLYESTSNATNIEVIKNKIFVASGGSSSSGSVSKMFSFDDMWDVSEIPAETKLSINGKNYFSLDRHTIIEI